MGTWSQKGIYGQVKAGTPKQIANIPKSHLLTSMFRLVRAIPHPTPPCPEDKVGCLIFSRNNKTWQGKKGNVSLLLKAIMSMYV